MTKVIILIVYCIIAIVIYFELYDLACKKMSDKISHDKRTAFHIPTGEIWIMSLLWPLSIPFELFARFIKRVQDKIKSRHTKKIGAEMVVTHEQIETLRTMVPGLSSKKSVIKWQTGVPTVECECLVTELNGNVTCDCWCVYEHYQYWEQHADREVIAWCPLSEIGPYKE